MRYQGLTPIKGQKRSMYYRLSVGQMKFRKDAPSAEYRKATERGNSGHNGNGRHLLYPPFSQADVRSRPSYQKPT